MKLQDGKYKVLHVTTIDITIRKVLVDKLKELEKYGYIIETMSDVTGFVSEIEKLGFPHHRIQIERQIRLLKDLKSMFEMYRFLKKNKYDIIHTHTAKAGVIGRIAGRLAGVPIVVHTSHGLPFYEGQSHIKNFIYKNLERIASWFSDGYFSQNKEDLSRIEKLVPKRVLTGYEGNGVSEAFINGDYRLPRDKIKHLRKQFGLNDETFVFLMGARFEKVKNHDMLINALKRIQDNYPFKVLLAGEGPLKKKIQEDVIRFQLGDKVEFLGYRNDIINLIQMADGIILTSEKEGIPRIIMEAMSFEKPVLATDVLGTRELVVHKQTGELVSLNDIEQLASSIKQWVTPSYKNTLIKYGQAGRERIINHFTEAIVANRINLFYQELIKSKNLRSI